MPAAVPLLGRQLVLLRQRLLTDKTYQAAERGWRSAFCWEKTGGNIDYGKIFIDKR